MIIKRRIRRKLIWRGIFKSAKMALFRPKNFYRQKNTNFCNLEKILDFTPIFVGLKKVQKDFYQSETTWQNHVIIFISKISINFKTKNLAFRVEKFHLFSFLAKKRLIFQNWSYWQKSPRFRPKMTKNWNSRE